MKPGINRLGFLILSILRGSGATGRLSSMTVREIASAEDCGMKENTIFERSGHVGRGLKEGHADTFFITADGLGLLEEERGKES